MSRQGSDLAGYRLPTAPAAATPGAVAAALLGLLLSEVLGDRAHDSATDSTEDTMTSLVAEEGTASATSHCTKETAVLLGHGRSIGVIVGGLGV